MGRTQKLYQIADELRGIANQGRYFAERSPDLENYERVLELSARLIGVIEQRDTEEIAVQFKDLLFHVTPISGVDTAVFQNNKLLLIKRHDNGLWCMPGGAMDIGETPVQTAVRELWEETGVRGQVRQLLGIFDSRFWANHINVQVLMYVFQCEIIEGTPQPTEEAIEVGFFGEDELPSLAPGHIERVPFLFKLFRGELPSPYFDKP